MGNARGIGLAVSLLGLLLMCCICPLSLNALFVIATNGTTSIYGPIFSPRFGNLLLSTYVIAAQYLCIAILAVFVLLLGVVLVLPDVIQGKPLVVRGPKR